MTDATKPEKILCNPEPIRQFWRIRLQRVKASLEKNNFEAFVVDSGEESKKLVMKQILPATGGEKRFMGRHHDHGRDRAQGSSAPKSRFGNH